jgi:hypothetical protein
MFCAAAGAAAATILPEMLIATRGDGVFSFWHRIEESFSAKLKKIGLDRIYSETKERDFTFRGLSLHTARTRRCEPQKVKPLGQCQKDLSGFHNKLADPLYCG